MNKHFNKILFLLLALMVGISACKKDGTFVTATSGTQPRLTASATTLNYSEADSANNAVSFTYASSDYGYKAAVGSELEFSYKDSNFTSYRNYTLSIDTSSMSFTVANFNNLVLGLNYVAGVKDTVYVRVKSTLTGATVNNNPIFKYSDTIAIVITPYSQIPIPVIVPPANLYIVGDATPGGWSNPVSIPSQKFTQIDQYGQVFGMVLQLNAGGSFLFLPVNGSWDHKYGGTSATGGTLLVDGNVPGSNTPGPATSGLYEIIVNFTKGTYSITPVATNPIPANLYIVGDATPGGWNNPVPVPSQQFTQVSNGDFQITVPLLSTGSYLFLPVNGSWDHKYGGTLATGGTLLVDGNVPGSNTPHPAVAGNYLIDVNILASTYTLKKQ